MHTMILKQHTQHSPNDYAPDGPISKEQYQTWVKLFVPLENTIRDQLISALVGQEVSDAERQILGSSSQARWARSDKS